MRKQKIIFELDNKLSNKAVDTIFDVLNKEGAEEIVHDYEFMIGGFSVFLSIS